MTGRNKRLDTFGNRARLDLVDEDRLGFSQETPGSTVLQNPPAFVTYSQAGTRQMDVNFDKRGDFVNLEPGFGAMKVNTFFIERGGAWTAQENHASSQLSAGQHLPAAPTANPIPACTWPT